jgi:DNA polymerase-3 subunit gamma/tau
MAYLVLARKYRPQVFADLVGQEFTAQTLRNAIRNGRTGHSYLFSGPRGVGKTSAARILAKAVNCINREAGAGEPCNTCPDCVEITNGQSLDVVEIDGASNRGIDEIRNLRETVKYAPARCAFKVYIIDEVHMLTKEAFNALLKTLEEPPSHVIFVFATTEPQNVPITILSRCQRYDFRKIPADLIASHIRGILEKEKISAEEEALLAVSRHSGGCLRDAETVLDQLIAFGDGTVRASDANAVLGLVRQDSCAYFFDCAVDDRKKDGLLFLKKLDEDGVDPSTFFSGFLEFLRGVMILQNTSPEEARTVLDATDKELETYKLSADRTDPSTVLAMMDILADGQKELKWSSLPRVTAEILFFRLADAGRGLNLRNLYRQVQSMNSRTPSAPSAVPAARAPGSAASTASAAPAAPAVPTAAPPRPAAQTAAEMIRKYSTPQPSAVPDEKKKHLTAVPDPERLKSDWPVFLDGLTDQRLLFLKKTANCLSLASADTASGEMTVAVTNRMLFSMLQAKDVVSLLAENFRARFGSLPVFKFALDLAEPKLPGPGTTQPSPAAETPHPEVHDPIYRKAVEIFGGSYTE